MSLFKDITAADNGLPKRRTTDYDHVNWQVKSPAITRVFQKSLRAKIREGNGWGWNGSEDLPTDLKFEILQYTTGEYAFRVWTVLENPKLQVTEVWLHPSDTEDVWELYPRLKGSKPNGEWEASQHYLLTWNPDLSCFTKGVSKLPWECITTVEVLNRLVGKIQFGFEACDNARIIYGESPFEEPHV